MSSLAAVAVLATSVGGFLAEGPSTHGAHLLEGVAVAQAAAVTATPAALRERIAELSDARPSLGAPIALAVVGGVFTLTGLGFLVGALMVQIAISTIMTSATLSAFFLAYLVIGLVGVGVGLPLLITGLVLLPKAIRRRKELGREVKELERTLRQLEAQPPQGAPPPPPAGLVVPSAPVLVAEF